MADLTYPSQLFTAPNSFTLTLTNASSHTFWMGPATGTAGTPSYRSPFASDLGTGGSVGQVLTVSGTAGALTWATPSTGSAPGILTVVNNATAQFTIAGSPVTLPGTLTITASTAPSFSTLTNGQVVVAGAGGALTSSSNMTFTSQTLAVNGTINATQTLTVGTGGTLTGAGNLITSSSANFGGNILAQNGTTQAEKVLIGDVSANGGFPGIWFGANANSTSQSYTNFSFLYDSSQGTILNSPAGKVIFRIGNTEFANVGSQGFSAHNGANQDELILLGDVSNNGGFPGIWFGANCTGISYSNFSFLYDKTVGTIFNAPANGILFRSANVTKLTMNSAGNLGIGVTSPTSRLHLGVGGTSSSSSPLKMISGPLLATPEAGAWEFQTDNAFLTITTGAARKGFVLDDGARLTSGLVPVATTNGRVMDSGVSATGSTLSLTSVLATNATITNATVTTLSATTILTSGSTSAGTYLSTTVAIGSTVGLTNATPANVTSVLLPPGHWQVSGVVNYVAGVASTSDFKAGTSATSATFGPQDSFINMPFVATGITDTFGEVAPPTDYDFRTQSTTTTVYLIGQASFSLGTIAAYGTIKAWKVN